MKRQSFIIILILLFLGNIAYGQNYSSDSLKVENLKKQLSKSTGEKRFKILLELSDLKKYFPDGTKYAQEAVELSAKLDDKAKSDAYYSLGYTFRMNMKDSEALLFAKNSLEISTKISYTNGILRAKHEITSCYYQIDSLQQFEKYAKDLLGEATKYDSIRYIGKAITQLGIIEQQKENLDSALILLNKGLGILQENGNSSDIAGSYSTLGDYFFEVSDFIKALEYYTKEIFIRESLNDQMRLALAYLNFGKTCRNLSMDQLAIENINKASVIFEKHNFVIGTMTTWNELGFIYMELPSTDDNSNLNKALEFFQKELDLTRSIGNEEYEAVILINVGNVYWGLASNKYINKYGKEFRDSIVNIPPEEIATAFSKAVETYKKALTLFQKLNFRSQEDATAYCSLGGISILTRKWSEAESYLAAGLRIAKSDQNSYYLINVLRLLGECKLLQGKLDEAEMYLIECSQLYKKHIDKISEIECLELLAKVYFQKGNTSKAIELFNKTSKMKDEIAFDKSRETVRSAQKQYQALLENTKKLYEKEKIIQKSTIEQQKLFLNITIVGSLFLVSIALFSIWLLLQKRRVNRILESSYKELDEQNFLIESKNIMLEEQKEEITAQRDEIIVNQNMIVQQNDLLARKNSDMLDSILYAKRIQEALLPNEHYIDEVIPDNFIIHKPRDVVSGDFYWIRQVNQYTIIVAADCTGHGVPGAFMSMLGISMLNEIVVRRGITQANVILNELRKQLKRSLRQTGKDQEAKDGMDMALCILDTSANHLQYSGAYNPLILATQGEIQEYSADRMPIGIQLNEKPTFTNHEIDLKPGDTFYIFTDGFVDQLGGPAGKKFMMKELKNLLTKINEKSLPEQRYILENTLADWMKGSEQTDDILIMGFRV